MRTVESIQLSSSNCTSTRGHEVAKFRNLQDDDHRLQQPTSQRSGNCFMYLGWHFWFMRGRDGGETLFQHLSWMSNQRSHQDRIPQDAGMIGKLNEKARHCSKGPRAADLACARTRVFLWTSWRRSGWTEGPMGRKMWWKWWKAVREFHFASRQVLTRLANGQRCIHHSHGRR